MILSRSATISDTESLALICRETFYDTYHLQNTEADMALYIQQYLSNNCIRSELENIKNTFIIMLDDTIIIGYAKLSESIVPKALQPLIGLQISRIYITKKYTGKGIGKQLMQMSIQLAKEKNKHIIWLGVWEKNQHAINFYQQFGFEKFGEEIFVLGKDEQTDWLMEKQL